MTSKELFNYFSSDPQTISLNYKEFSTKFGEVEQSIFYRTKRKAKLHLNIPMSAVQKRARKAKLNNCSSNKILHKSQVVRDSVHKGIKSQLIEYFTKNPGQLFLSTKDVTKNFGINRIDAKTLFTARKQAYTNILLGKTVIKLSIQETLKKLFEDNPELSQIVSDGKTIKTSKNIWVEEEVII